MREAGDPIPPVRPVCSDVLAKDSATVRDAAGARSIVVDGFA
jgi:hypothetical protein